MRHAQSRRVYSRVETGMAVCLLWTEAFMSVSFKDVAANGRSLANRGQTTPRPSPTARQLQSAHASRWFLPYLPAQSTAMRVTTLPDRRLTTNR